MQKTLDTFDGAILKLYDAFVLTDNYSLDSKIYEEQLLSYQAFLKFGHKCGITPKLLSNEEFQYIFKNLMREKTRGVPNTLSEEGKTLVTKLRRVLGRVD